MVKSKLSDKLSHKKNPVQNFCKKKSQKKISLKKIFKVNFLLDLLQIDFLSAIYL